MKSTKGAHPRLLMAMAWPECPEGALFGVPGVQNTDERAAVERIPNGEVRQARNAVAIKAHVQDGLKMIGGHRGRQPHVMATHVCLQRPSLDQAGAGKTMEKACVSTQLVRVLWRAAVREVRRGTDAQQPGAAEVAGVQSGVGGTAGANDGVEALFDDIDKTVAEVQVEFDGGKAACKRRKHGQHQSTYQRKADFQTTAGRGMGVGQLALRCGDLGHDATAAFKELLAFGSQADAAGIAVQEAGAQTLLQPGDGLACRRRGDATLSRCGREAACLGDQNEDAETGKAVHRWPLMTFESLKHGHMGGFFCNSVVDSINAVALGHAGASSTCLLLLLGRPDHHALEWCLQAV